VEPEHRIGRLSAVHAGDGKPDFWRWSSKSSRPF
jgi:hypothetical protein